VRQNGNGPIAYFPWGEERPGANGTTPDGTDKFATYFRDATNNGVGEDYASARYYNNNFGRFWSPDPGGNAHANDPQSWNRYAYVRNDPTNGSDPTGLGSVCTVFAADDSTCIVGVPAPSPSCWGGDVDDPVFTCFGEGSGMLDSAPSSSNPNLNRQTWLMYLRQQMALAAASILASNVSRAGSAQVPAFLAASSECWAPAAPSAGSLTYTLEVTYQIEDSTGAPMNASSLSGIFVNESFLSVTGSSGAGIIANAATWYTGEPGGGGIQTNGTFTDYLSAGGISGLSTLSAAAFQTFTATGILTNGMVLQSQPLTVLGFGAPTTVLNNVYTQTNVTINGFGLGTNPKTECH
jgi:RHS repeat-associated protein